MRFIARSIVGVGDLGTGLQGGWYALGWRANYVLYALVANASQRLPIRRLVIEAEVGWTPINLGLEITAGENRDKATGMIRDTRELTSLVTIREELKAGLGSFLCALEMRRSAGDNARCCRGKSQGDSRPIEGIPAMLNVASGTEHLDATRRELRDINDLCCAVENRVSSILPDTVGKLHRDWIN